MTQVFPDAYWRFGPYGVQYIPETLTAARGELERAYAEAHPAA